MKAEKKASEFGGEKRCQVVARRRSAVGPDPPSASEKKESELLGGERRLIVDSPMKAEEKASEFGGGKRCRVVADDPQSSSG